MENKELNGKAPLYRQREHVYIEKHGEEKKYWISKIRRAMNSKIVYGIVPLGELSHRSFMVYEDELKPVFSIEKVLANLDKIGEKYEASG